MQIIDDFLPEAEAESVRWTLLNEQMPWFFLDNISGYAGEAKNVQYGFYHLLFHQPDGGVTSGVCEQVGSLLDAAGAAANGELWRARVGLSTNIGGLGVAHPHIDYTNEHTVVLYYVNDSDGDTVLYDGHPDTGLSVAEKITPVHNRAVIFDGLRYHSSSYPVKDSRRVVVNMNFF